jgi:Rps23 Pro-64 3,4-dihydroxylase Tpa1-like proline 4-hydroxylase
MSLNTLWIDLSRVSFNNTPYPFFIGEDVISKKGDQLFLEWLEVTNAWTLTKADFYTQNEFSLLDIEVPEQLQWLVSPKTVHSIETQFSTHFPIKKMAVRGITVHQLLDGHRIGIHNDYIQGEETHRLIIQLNRNWHETNGGYLMLFNSSDPEDVFKVIKPISNSAFGFEISPNSYHAVSSVYEFSRYTLVYSFKSY